MSAERYRNSAHSWGVYQHAAEPSIWFEWFFLPSWAEHLREHERVNRHDQGVHDSVRVYHGGEAPPEVCHYLALTRTPGRRHAKPETGGAKR